jgi:hypothetical protein
MEWVGGMNEEGARFRVLVRFHGVIGRRPPSRRGRSQGDILY